ncbi:S-adenosyl-L-methionine-dependent methyltransferase [Atractiella rhizophila]|nr:S-adenosyl-L-methionine-dependent methyltransferase [Atractiella rhizophila]
MENSQREIKPLPPRPRHSFTLSFPSLHTWFQSSVKQKPQDAGEAGKMGSLEVSKSQSVREEGKGSKRALEQMEEQMPHKALKRMRTFPVIEIKTPTLRTSAAQGIELNQSDTNVLASRVKDLRVDSFSSKSTFEERSESNRAPGSQAFNGFPKPVVEISTHCLHEKQALKRVRSDTSSLRSRLRRLHLQSSSATSIQSSLSTPTKLSSLLDPIVITDDEEIRSVSSQTSVSNHTPRKRHRPNEIEGKRRSELQGTKRKKAKKGVGATFYGAFKVPAGVVDEDTKLDGEREARDEDIDESGEMTKLVREMTDFVLVDWNTKQIIDFNATWDDSVDARLVGKVKAIDLDDENEQSEFWHEFLDEEEEEEEEEEEDDEQGVLMVTDAIEQVQAEQLDSVNGRDKVVALWVEGDAWYRLNKPARAYEVIFQPYVRYIHLFAAAMEAIEADEHLSFADFCGSLDKSGVYSTPRTFPSHYLDSPLTAKDATFHKRQLFEDLHYQIGDWIFEDSSGDHEWLRDVDDDDERQRARKSKGQKQETQTHVTPIVDAITGSIFSRALKVIRRETTTEGEDQDEEEEVEDPPEHRRDNRDGRRAKTKHEANQIHFVGPPLLQKDGIAFWTQCRVGSENLGLGDIVEILGTSDRGLEETWLGQILKIYQDGHGRYAHVRWFAHGPDTAMGELASESEIFALTSCDNIPLGSIIKALDEPELIEPDDSDPKLDRKKLHYRYTYSDETGSFRQFETSEQPSYDMDEGNTPRCPLCEPYGNPGRPEWIDPAHMKKGFRLQDRSYHRSDNVYFPSGKDYTPFGIGTIVSFHPLTGGGPETVSLRLYLRYRNLPSTAKLLKRSQGMLEDDERELIGTDIVVTVEADQILGRCQIGFRTNRIDLRSVRNQDDTFHVSHEIALAGQAAVETYLDVLDLLSSPDFRLPRSRFLALDKATFGKNTCPVCKKDSEERLKRLNDTKGSPLSCLDLFAGAGGFSTGLAKSEIILSKWAIEFSFPAAKTFAANHPEATVYLQDTNQMLGQAMKESGRSNAPPVRDLEGATLPPMPQHGEVDIIVGGPPCQGFSLANGNRSPDDIRCSLIANYLSYVEFYRPKYFIIENVKGMVDFSLEGQNGKIKHGVIKLIYRVATALGYQVTAGLILASNQGSPQNRLRVIFIGAAKGLKLPSLPQPTHTHPRAREMRMRLPTGTMMSRVTNGELKAYGAPHKCVTILDAIVDLPGFEYENEGRVVPLTALQKKKQRQSQLPRIKADRSPVGFLQAEYDFPPKNAYQEQMRENSEDLVLHWTRHWTTSSAIERIWHAPFTEGMGWRTLPKQLHFRTARKQSTLSRLQNDGFFECIMTVMNPFSRGSRSLHPTQRRMCTIREFARAQGYPDDYIFVTTEQSKNGVSAEGSLTEYNDIMRQIGNSVPIPMGRAIGLEIRKSMMCHHPSTGM